MEGVLDAGSRHRTDQGSSPLEPIILPKALGLGRRIISSYCNKILLLRRQQNFQNQ